MGKQQQTKFYQEKQAVQSTLSSNSIKLIYTRENYRKVGMCTKCNQQVTKEKWSKHICRIKPNMLPEKKKRINKNHKMKPNYFMVQIRAQNNHRAALCTICRDVVLDMSWATHKCTKKYYSNIPNRKALQHQKITQLNDKKYWKSKTCFTCHQPIIKRKYAQPQILFCIYCFNVLHNKQKCYKLSQRKCDCFSQPLELINQIEPAHFPVSNRQLQLGLKSYRLKHPEKVQQYQKAWKQIQEQLNMRGNFTTRNFFWEGFNPDYSLNKDFSALCEKDSKVVRRNLNKITRIPIKMVPMEKMEYGMDIIVLQDIQAEVFICQYAGDIIPIKYARLAHNYVMNYMQGPNSRRQYIIAPIIHWSLGNLLNHDDEPNVEILRCMFDKQPVVLMYTIKSVKAGSSLRYNYNGNETTVKFYDINFAK